MPAPDRGSRAERRALARRGAEAYGAAPRAAAELERRIAAIWSEVLRRREPGIHDNFFEMGGDSLLLVELHRRLLEIAGDVALVELFQHPTIASMARHLAATMSREEVGR